MNYFRLYVKQIEHYLSNIVVTNNKRETINVEYAMEKWIQLTRKISETNKVMYFIGNGASAMMASHMAADATKNGGFRSMALNDAALLTAVSNDISYEEVFALPLNRYANEGDALVTISSSGNSPNIIKGIEVGRQIGMNIITLSGMKPNNKSRKLGDLNFYIPASTYGLVEIAHQALLHCWLDKYQEEEKGMVI